MNGNWPAFHALVQCYKEFLPASLHPALIINFVAGLDPPMARKVNKDPKPTTLDAAIDRAWRYFRSANYQDFMPYSAMPSFQPAVFPSAAPSPMHMPPPVFPSVTSTSTSTSPFQTAASTATAPPASAATHAPPHSAMELDAMRHSPLQFPYSGPTLAYGQVQQQLSSSNAHYMRPAMRTDAYNQAIQHAAAQFHAFQAAQFQPRDSRRSESPRRDMRSPRDSREPRDQRDRPASRERGGRPPSVDRLRRDDRRPQSRDRPDGNDPSRSSRPQRDYSRGRSVDRREPRRDGDRSYSGNRDRSYSGNRDRSFSKGQRPSYSRDPPRAAPTDESRPRRSQSPSQRPRSDGACFNCGKLGHIQRDCPERAQPSSSKQ